MDANIANVLREKGIELNKMQKEAYKKIIDGKHVLITAPTGFGKTEAAILPIFEHFLKQPRKPISILYITPLRALNRDLLERITWYADRLGIRVAVRHGDTPQSQRTKQTRKPPDLLITTPETLGAILPAKKMGEHLRNVRWVIIDEVHELVTSKRGTQLSLLLLRLQKKAGTFQKVGLSATVGSIKKVMEFFGFEELVDYSRTREMDLKVIMPKPNEEDYLLSLKLLVDPGAVARLRVIKELVDQEGALLTFVNTRQMAELLASRFEAWDKEHNISVHHSSLSKDVRIVAEKAFKEGSLKGIIATSSLELGIDIGRINAVVQYMSPRQVCRLIQRVGRSGHKMERIPKGIIICSDPEDVLESDVICDKAKKYELEEIKIPEKPYDVLASQIVGYLLDGGQTTITELYSLFKSAYPYKDLTREEFEQVVDFLANEGLIWREGEWVGKKRGVFRYYFENLSTIPDESKFFVRDIEGKLIATLDESFVVNNLKPGTIFIAKGLPWRVVSIEDEKVYVEPAQTIEGAIPSWEGQEIPVPFEVAQEVFSRYYHGQTFFTDAETRENVMAWVEKQKKTFIPDPKTIFIESYKNYVIIHCAFGSLINETIGNVLAALITSRLGKSVRFKASPYRIIFEFEEPRPDLIIHYLTTIKPDQIEPIINASIVRSPIFRWKFLHVARRFGLVPRGMIKISPKHMIAALGDSPVFEEAMKEVKFDLLDIEGAKRVFEGIQKKEIAIKEVKPLSELGKLAFTKTLSLSEVFVPNRAENEILNMMKKSIAHKKVTLRCMYCGNVFHRIIANLPESIRCPKCGSNAILYEKHEKLKKREKEKIVSLIQAYGKKAIIALSFTGIGPDAAARILGRLRKKEEQFYKDILEEQKRFLETKKYWRV